MIEPRAGVHRAMALAGAAQGFALWLLFENWPEAHRAAAVFVALVFFVCVASLVLHMGRTGSDRGRILALAGAAGAVFGLVALWVGWQLPPEGAPHGGDETRVWSWVLAAGIALYALGPYVQIYQATGAARFPYPLLTRNAWNNFFIATLGVLFAVALWIVLMLWGALFGLIGIEFFEDLFEEEAFAYPVTGAALGYGLAVARDAETVVATLRGLTQSLFRSLLPLLALVTLAFVGSLPFTGLDPLFATRSAASILIPWIAAHVLFLNAVYLDGEALPPYRREMRWLGELGILVLPGLAAVTLYALWLRIDQHGLTPERVFGLAVAGVLALYVGGYALAVLRRGAPWLPWVRAVNSGLAWVVVLLCLALHTPLLDPLGWSLRNQLARLASGRVAVEEFDFGFLRFHLGARGHAALEQLASDPALAGSERLTQALEVESYWRWERAHVRRVAAGALERVAWDPEWPAGLREALERGARSELPPIPGCREETPCLGFPVDVDGDGSSEQGLATTAGRALWILVFEPAEAGEWRYLGRYQRCLAESEAESWAEEIRARRVVPAPARYRDLALGDVRAAFQPECDLEQP